MRASMGSVHIGGKPEENRSSATLEPGEMITVKQITHRWKEPPPDPPGKPHIANGSAKLTANRGDFFCAVFLGRHPADEPLTFDEIERRLNKLGWFRRENG